MPEPHLILSQCYYRSKGIAFHILAQFLNLPAVRQTLMFYSMRPCCSVLRLPVIVERCDACLQTHRCLAIDLAGTGVGAKLIPLVNGVSSGKIRPAIPSGTPQPWSELMQRYWSGDASKRPTFMEILKELRSMILPDGTAVYLPSCLPNCTNIEFQLLRSRLREFLRL